MELDVRIDKDAISISIDEPFRLDLDSLVGRIEQFLTAKGHELNGLAKKPGPVNPECRNWRLSRLHPMPLRKRSNC